MNSDFFNVLTDHVISLSFHVITYKGRYIPHKNNQVMVFLTVVTRGNLGYQIIHFSTFYEKPTIKGKGML